MSGPSIHDVDAAVRAVLAGGSSDIFAGRLLGLRQAEAIATGTKEVRIAPGTVVTPMARDHLKRQGMTVRVVSGEDASRGGRRGEWGFAIEVETGQTAALRRALLEGPASWREVGRATLAAARWVVGDPERGAAVLTAEASVAVWKANRIGGVRAATVSEAEAVERAVRHLGANVLVIEPSGKSIYQVRHWLDAFRRGGAPSVPAGLEEESHEDRRGDRPGHALSQSPEPAERALRDRLAVAANRTDRGEFRAW